MFQKHKTKILIGVLALIILGGATFFFIKHKKDKKANKDLPQSAPAPKPSPKKTALDAPELQTNSKASSTALTTVDAPKNDTPLDL